ncbi:MAG: FHA domain-containing protein [Rhodanobacteraceae bacterium]
MKLIFPNGEHGSFTLVEGTTRIGSATGCEIVLQKPGVAPHHAEIDWRVGEARVRPVVANAPVVLNGQRIEVETALKAGDLLLFSGVNCRVVAIARLEPAAPVRPSIDSDGRTLIRSALPQFVLRGVSGQAFGKRIAVIGEMTIGRQSDCDIAVPASEISRLHARLKAGVEGVMVEDMGSSNGTYINDKRVQFGLLRPGDELRLDTVRFRLATTAMDLREQIAGNQEVAAPAPISARNGRALTVTIALLALAIVVIAVLFFLS